MRESVTAQHEAGDFYSLGAAVRSFSRQGNLTDERDAHLADQLLEKARNISGGMLRRLGLAATLVHDPQLQ